MFGTWGVVGCYGFDVVGSEEVGGVLAGAEGGVLGAGGADGSGRVEEVREVSVGL